MFIVRQAGLGSQTGQPGACPRLAGSSDMSRPHESPGTIVYTGHTLALCISDVVWIAT